jgi:hypothetical protein
MSMLAPPPVSAPPNGAPDEPARRGGASEKWTQLIALPVVLTATAESFSLLQGWQDGHALLVLLALGTVMTGTVVAGFCRRRLSGQRALTGLLTIAATIVLAIFAVPAVVTAIADGESHAGDGNQVPPSGGVALPTSPGDPDVDPSQTPPSGQPSATYTASPEADAPSGGTVPQTTAGPLPPVVAAGAPSPDTSTGEAVCTPNPGRLSFTQDSLSNSGGPNYVPDGCSEIGLELTAVTQVIHAQACLETADGTPTGQCGEWVRLVDGGAWNVLYASANPGTRWILHMTAAGPDTVEFSFTG